MPIIPFSGDSTDVQLSLKYQPTSNGFLLVINAETPQAELSYWNKILTQLAGNLPIAIWNTSYYDNKFKLDDPDISPTLLEDIEHGTVVILNNDFNTGMPGINRNSQFITATQVFKASHDHNVSLLVVGARSVGLEAELSEREWSERAGIVSHPSVDELMQALLKEPNRGLKLPFKVG